MFHQTRPHPEWKILAAKTCALPWGTLVTYDEMESVMGLRRNDDRWGGNIARWKKEMLREYQRPVAVVRNVGYRILEFNEIVPRAKHLVRLGARSMGRGVSVVEHAPYAEMPDTERRAAIDFGVRAGMLVQMCREKLKEPKLKGGTEGSTTPRVLKSAK